LKATNNNPGCTFNEDGNSFFGNDKLDGKKNKQTNKHKHE